MSNRLADSRSPYLQQHADNPVDWWPWSEEAFAEAKRRDVPVLVSIGYSTCHWCHVMAHECFEDTPTAELMNEHFVNIKVDREEHPEVDEIYMDAVQAMTGQGGWPLNAFLDHAGRPFFAGTYFPRENWHKLLQAISNAWTSDRQRLSESAQKVAEHLRQSQHFGSDELQGIWSDLDGALDRSYDAEHPGFAYSAQRQPKFPPSGTLALLLERGPEAAPLWWERTQAILTAMQDSGLHDRVGGGFHRYSVDRLWRVPHFEKMLYDNAQLMGAYAVAARRCDRLDFLATARNAADYVLRDLRIERDGALVGYASAEDADDPGGEGSFYAWSPVELEATLGAEDAGRLAVAWDITPGERELGPSGHYEPVASHIPHPRGVEEAPTVDARMQWEEFLPILRARRDERPRPGLDDKVITDLNGLFMEGLSLVARSSGDEHYYEALRELVAAMADRIAEDGTLTRLPGRPGFITDYGHLALGLTGAYQALGEPSLVDRAELIAERALSLFRAEDGGFYTTPAGRADLVRRSRDDMDNAYPTGSAALALAMARLWQITGDEQWRARAADAVTAAGGLIRRVPSAMATMLRAHRAVQSEATRVVVTGSDARAAELLHAARAHFDADVMVVEQADRPWPILEGRRDIAEPQALVCTGTTCLAPIVEVDGLRETVHALRGATTVQSLRE